MRCLLWSPGVERYSALIKDGEDAGRLSATRLLDDEITLCWVTIVKCSDTLAKIYMDVMYKNEGFYYYDSLVDIKDGMLDLDSIRE